MRLGNCYWDGLGLKQDDEEDFRLYDEAVRRNESVPYALGGGVGACLVLGLGVVKDKAKGMKYLAVH